MSKEKSTTLRPSSLVHFWWYLLGVVLIPVFGVGIWIIYQKYSQLKSERYLITDRTITAESETHREKTDLVNIIETTIQQRWIDKRFGIGSVFLKTDTKTVALTGMKNPESLANMILSAAEAERVRKKELEKKVNPEPPPQSGQLDKMDYLTGLWQQGLISEEDYEKERKHFES